MHERVKKYGCRGKVVTVFRGVPEARKSVLGLRERCSVLAYWIGLDRLALIPVRFSKTKPVRGEYI